MRCHPNDQPVKICIIGASPPDLRTHARLKVLGFGVLGKNYNLIPHFKTRPVLRFGLQCSQVNAWDSVSREGAGLTVDSTTAL